jgi:hypothetical protein
MGDQPVALLITYRAEFTSVLTGMSAGGDPPGDAVLDSCGHP